MLFTMSVNKFAALPLQRAQPVLANPLPDQSLTHHAGFGLWYTRNVLGQIDGQFPIQGVLPV